MWIGNGHLLKMHVKCLFIHDMENFISTAKAYFIFVSPCQSFDTVEICAERSNNNNYDDDDDDNNDEKR